MKVGPGTECAGCGRLIPGDAPGGICPRCLLGLGRAGWDPGAETVEMAGLPEPTAPAAMTCEEVGRLLPDFQVIGLLGIGGMGAVYQARQPRLERIVAIKILPGRRSLEDPFRQRFEREARAMAALNHPHIVTIHDFGVVEGLCYIVMEYVDGSSLRELIRTGGVDPAAALALIPQICEALQYAHDQGFVHRDIKPGNLLVNRRGWVKIADFGLAKLLVGENPAEGSSPSAAGVGASPGPDLTQAGQLMGTPHYMAPEQRERPLGVDRRADIYSLGVVIYEMLTGELPQQDLVPPSRKVRVDVRIDEVVLRALDREPLRRYQQASEIKERVDALRAAPDEPPPPRRRWVRPVVAAAACAVLAGGLAVQTRRANPVAAKPGASSLLEAAARPDAGEVRRLLAAGAAPGERDADGNTPVLLAARSGDWESVQALLAAGADAGAVNAREEGALHLAASGGWLESMAPPASPAPDEGYLAILSRLVELGSDVNAWTAEARTPIHYAAYGGRPALVEFLAGRGALLTLPDARDGSPLHAAARAGAAEVLSLLIRRGVPATSVERGVTALHWACAGNHAPSLDVLLANGADPNARDGKSETPMHWAAQKGSREALLLLLAKGALPDPRNVHYQTPLHLAVLAGHYPAVKILCEGGASLQARALDARSPLDLARAEGRGEILRYLEGRADPKEP